jgi:hypothetical protein
MREKNILEKFQLEMAAIKIHGKEVFYEESHKHSIIPFDRWDSEISTQKTANIFLNENITPATNEEWSSWLRKKDPDNLFVEFDFKYDPNENGVALCVELDNFDQSKMVLTLDRRNEYWVLGEYPDLEMEGFFVVAAVPSKNLDLEEAFPYLMSFYHLWYFNLMVDDHGNEEEFSNAILAFDIVLGISSEAQQVARNYATEFYESVKENKEFWKEF